jgi:phosphate:Na+ symporter
MALISLLLRLAGGLCMFLFGMKMMSDGIQQSAGDRLRKTLNYMTGSRFTGMLTGFVVTGIVQSSSAVTVMVVSFVNAGLLTLTQSIGVIMGANIGTTVTAWIVSLIGFNLNISSLAIPSVGIGFILSIIKWKHRSVGDIVMGFGFLFLGLYFLTQEMSGLSTAISFDSIGAFSHMGFSAIMIGAGAGFVMTLLFHSSSATTAMVLTMVFNNIVTYQMAAGMVLGANVGTTVDAVLASIGAKTAARRAAMVHVLFNLIGALWALPLLKPLLLLVDFITPGSPVGIGATEHLAMLHTVFNTVNTILFLPFVNQFAKLVTFLVRESKPEEESKHYVFAAFSGVITETTELKILRVEKEIRDMADIASSMYASFSEALRGLRESGINAVSGGADGENAESGDRNSAVAKLCEEMQQKEMYTYEMREILTGVLIECTRVQLNIRTEQRVTHLLRIINGIEEMSDECYSISRLLEKSVRKNRIFRKEEMDELVPYVYHVEQFLSLLQMQLSRKSTAELAVQTMELEEKINTTRKRLRKLSRKRIEAGMDVQTELIFIDLVRRIERLGDYCASITAEITS